MTPPLCVFGFAETALVNQALAKSAPGLGPSGFDPHAFARPGLRAPLAPGQGGWGVTEQKVHLSPAPSRPYSAFGLFRTLAVHSQHVQPISDGARFTFMS